MPTSSTVRMYAVIGAATLALSESPALAQFQPRPISALGERYHIEGSIGFWNPTTQMVISSESLGIVGTKIDLKKDLGLTDQRFRDLRAVLRASRKHKFRFEYIPIKFEQRAVISRNIIFNGQLYRVGVPVNSTIDWKAYRFAWEYDFLVKERGFGGFLLDFKHTNVKASLASPAPEIREFVHGQAPIPTIGGIGRVYVVPDVVSVTGELSGILIPSRVSKNFNAHYADLDIYGTVNFSRYFGAQLGVRSLDLGYLVDEDTGSFNLKGFYVAFVARY